MKKIIFTLKEKDFSLPLFVVLLLCCHLFISGFMTCTVGFDGGWNAEVAKNLAFNGRYAVTYPYDIDFYYIITTGQTVILPVALAYKIFGVSSFSTALFPLLYTAGLIIALAFLSVRVFSEFGLEKKYVSPLAAIVLTAVYFILNLSDELSYQVLGENAAALFIALAVIFFMRYEKDKKGINIFFVGFFAAFAFITKNVTLFFLFFAFVFAILYFVFFRERKELKKNILLLIGGFASGFIILDAVKFFVLGCSVKKYVLWWIDEIKYCFILNKATSARGSLSFIERLSVLSETFSLRFPLALIILLVIPLYILVAFIKSLVKKEEFKIPYAVLICSVSGESYVLFNLLFGEGAAISKRRLFVHLLFFFFASLCFALNFALKAYDEIKRERTKKRIIKAASGFLSLIIIFVFGFIPVFASLSEDKTEGRREQDAIVEVVKELPENSVFVSYDMFAPDVELITGITIKKLEEGEYMVSEGEKKVFYIADYMYSDDYVYENYEYEIIFRQNYGNMYNSVVELKKFKG